MCTYKGGRRSKIVVQQDNATAHKIAFGATVRAACEEDGWNIAFANQPPKSPDFNVLDLGFFNAIQALQFQKKAFDIDSLLGAVAEAFMELKSEAIDKTFMTLQSVMRESLFSSGGNSYSIPHLKKDQLLRHGGLPQKLACSKEAYDYGMAALQREY